MDVVFSRRHARQACYRTVIGYRTTITEALKVLKFNDKLIPSLRLVPVGDIPCIHYTNFGDKVSQHSGILYSIQAKDTEGEWGNPMGPSPIMHVMFNGTAELFMAEFDKKR